MTVGTGMGEQPTVKYKATVWYRRTAEEWRVRVVRAEPIGDTQKYTEIVRPFALRWSAVRFARSQRRILRAFRRQDLERTRVEVSFERQQTGEA